MCREPCREPASRAPSRGCVGLLLRSFSVSGGAGTRETPVPLTRTEAAPHPPRGITCGPRFRQLPVRAGDSHQPPGTSPHVQGCGSGLRADVAVTLAAILWPEPSPATGPRTHVSGDPGSSALSAFGAGAPPAAGSQTRPRRRPAPPLRRKRVASGAVCGPRGVPWPPEARPPAQCRLGLGAEGGPGSDADRVWGAPPASRRASRELAA